MALLKKLTLGTAWLVTLCEAAGCGMSTTIVSYVDTDTYISSSDPGNHSEQPTLRVSNATGANALEERGLLKLPTGKEDSGYNMDQIFGNLSDPLTWPVAPFVIIADIFAAFFNCQGPALNASSLTSAYLVLNVDHNAGGAPLAGITLQHLSKPWFQTVSWAQAFPFSGAGKWAQPGGDLDSSFTPIAATDPGDGTIKFDVTTYFKQLLSTTSQPHYGFLMRSANGATLSPVELASVQTTDSTHRPRLVSTYQCPGSSNHDWGGWGARAAQMETAGAVQAPAASPYVYYLGGR